MATGPQRATADGRRGSWLSGRGGGGAEPSPRAPQSTSGGPSRLWREGVSLALWRTRGNEPFVLETRLCTDQTCDGTARAACRPPPLTPSLTQGAAERPSLHAPSGAQGLWLYPRQRWNLSFLRPRLLPWLCLAVIFFRAYMRVSPNVDSASDALSVLVPGDAENWREASHPPSSLRTE